MPCEQVLVSIAIVTCNRRDLLARALTSAHAQSYRLLEVVLGDNASRDDTVAMVEKEWPAVKIIRLHRNIGCQPGRNIAMKNCRGKYIFNLDDDGILTRDTIECIVERFEADPDIAVIECETPPLEERPHYVVNKGKNERWIANFRGGAHAIRRSVLEKAGFFPEFPRSGSEAVMAARILDCGFRALHLPQAVMFHPSNQQETIVREAMYYAGGHYLKREVLMTPFPQCIFRGLWRSLRGLGRAVKNRCPGAYIRGVFRFFLDLPDALENRNPVTRDTMKIISFLVFNNLVNKEDILLYRGAKKMDLFRRRWRKRKVS